jgi:hypothetical protein
MFNFIEDIVEDKKEKRKILRKLVSLENHTLNSIIYNKDM